MDANELKLQLAEVAGTWTAAIAVIVGGFFGVFQYLEHKAAVRVDRTMAFVERYHSDGLLMEARLKLSDSMTEKVDEINQLLMNDSIEPEELASKYHAKIISLIAEDDLSSSLEQILTFYEQIILCRELNLCDSSVAEEFFDTDGRGFVRTYYPYVCQLRNQWNNPRQFERVVAFYIDDSQSLCDR